MSTTKAQPKVKSKVKSKVKKAAAHKVKVEPTQFDEYGAFKDLAELGVKYFDSRANYNTWLASPCKDFSGHLPPSVLIARGRAAEVKQWLQNRVHSPASGLYIKA